MLTAFPKVLMLKGLWLETSVKMEQAAFSSCCLDIFLLSHCEPAWNSSKTNINVLKSYERIRIEHKLHLHTRDIVSNDGVPRRSVIKSNWWTTFFPGNRGLPVNISANMQPMLHISIAGVYCQ